MAVLAPMPSARDSTATAAKTGDLRRVRSAKRRSLFIAESFHGIHAAGAPGWDVSGGAGHQREAERGNGERQRVICGDAVKLSLDETSKRDRCGQSSHQSDRNQRQNLA